MSTPTTAPAKFRAGTTVVWTIDAGDDYRPAAGWALTYRFTNGTALSTATGANNGDGTFLVTLSTTVTGALSAGDYSYSAIVAKSGEVFEVDSGTVTVTASFGVAAEGRSFAKQMLDAIESKLLSLATTGQFVAGAISVKDRSISYRSEQELRSLRDRYRAEYFNEVAAERIAKGLSTGRQIHTRFD